MEEWRRLSSGYYEASSLGRIRRCAPGRRTFVGKILKIQHSNKYPHVILSLGDRRLKQVAVHQLVAEAFFGKCPEGMEVNHKDLDKKNNCVSNLEYVTKQRNREHAHVSGAYRSGERHPMNKLRKEDIVFIRDRLDLSPKVLSSMYGVTDGHVRMIRSRRVWKKLI